VGKVSGVRIETETRGGAAPQDANAQGTTPTFRVADLVADSGEAILIHGADRYRLRITARGKLILTK
jgi:hemin uptake protein HemP